MKGNQEKDQYWAYLGPSGRGIRPSYTDAKKFSCDGTVIVHMASKFQAMDFISNGIAKFNPITKKDRKRLGEPHTVHVLVQMYPVPNTTRVVPYMRAISNPADRDDPMNFAQELKGLSLPHSLFRLNLFALYHALDAYAGIPNLIIITNCVPVFEFLNLPPDDRKKFFAKNSEAQKLAEIFLRRFAKNPVEIDLVPDAENYGLKNYRTKAQAEKSVKKYVSRIEKEKRIEDNAEKTVTEKIERTEKTEKDDSGHDSL